MQYCFNHLNTKTYIYALMRCYWTAKDKWRTAQRLQFGYQRRIYTSLLFRVLSTSTAASGLAKNTFKVRQVFNLLSILSAYDLYVKNGIQNEFPGCVFWKRRSVADTLQIFRIPIQTCDFSRAEFTLLHGCSPVT